MLTVLLPIWIEEVVKLTFAPTLAPVLKLPVAIVTTVLLTTVEPIVKLEVERFAVEPASDIFNRVELAFKLAVLLPIWIEDVVKLTFAPTLAPVLKSPVAIVRILLLTTEDPIVKLEGDKLAVELASDIFNRTELAFKFTVLLPI